MTRQRRLLCGLALALAVGAAIGVGAVWIAIDHNPQGEFYDTQSGDIELAATAPLFAGGLALGTLATLIIEVAAYVVISSIAAQRRKSSA